MMILVTTIHVVACVILVLVVLLQAGKGADMGAVFGGASSTIFGSSGAGNFLTRLTTGAAIVFMLTSLTLTYGTTRQTTATLMPEAGTVSPEIGGEAEGAPDAAEDAADTASASGAGEDEAVVDVPADAAAPGDAASAAGDAAAPVPPAPAEKAPAAP